MLTRLKTSSTISASYFPTSRLIQKRRLDIKLDSRIQISTDLNSFSLSLLLVSICIHVIFCLCHYLKFCICPTKILNHCLWLISTKRKVRWPGMITKTPCIHQGKWDPIRGMVLIHLHVPTRLKDLLEMNNDVLEQLIFKGANIC